MTTEVVIPARVTLSEQPGNPPTTLNNGTLFTKDVSGTTGLFFADDQGGVTQLTGAGAGITGSGSAGRIAFWSGASALTSDATLLYAAATGVAAAATDSATATVTDVLTLNHTTSGTPAANYGAGVLLRGQDASKTAGGDDMCRVATRWSTATAASEASVFAVGLRSAGAALPAVGAEQFRVAANGDVTIQPFSNTFITLNLGGTGSGVTGDARIAFTTNVRSAYLALDNASSQLITNASGLQLGTTAYLRLERENPSGFTRADTITAVGLVLATQGTARMTFGASGDITLGEGEDFILGTSTGTKIGTATTQKIGFYNATPIVRPTVSGSLGGNAALSSLVGALANLGLIGDSTSA